MKRNATSTKIPTLVCKFCGQNLTNGRDAFHAPLNVDEAIRPSVSCLNRGDRTTLHWPDAPEYNGGEDYADGRARREAPQP